MKESRNCVWLCRFCTRRLPICACLSPFLHVKPFSDVLFEYLLYLCKGHVTAIILSVYYQMTHVMSVLSWTHQRAGSFVVWKVRGAERGPKRGWGEKKKRDQTGPDNIWTQRVERLWGEFKWIFWLVLSPCLKINIRLWWNLHKPFLSVALVNPWTAHRSPTRIILSSTGSVLPSDEGQLTRVILVFTAVTVQWRSMPMYKLYSPD